MNVVLLSTYELGRQPFGLASPAAWLKHHGYGVTARDLAIDPLPIEAIRKADLIAFYTPMHTATRLAAQLIPKIRQIHPQVPFCFYGLYAPMNEAYLYRLGAIAVFGGEFETSLLQLCEYLEKIVPQTVHEEAIRQIVPGVSLKRQQFLIPDRDQLPGLSQYAQLIQEGKPSKLVGTVEASRGCKHRCRHCPVVPVYEGKFRIVQQEVVLADIRQQVKVGAEHITFGDPDFLNGPGHALPLVQALHREFPGLSYDVTVKVEHLLKYAAHLPALRDTGCVLITSAVESFDAHVLEVFDKGHTLQDFRESLQLLRRIELALNPTFVAFTPWTSLKGYRHFLKTLWEWELVEQVASVQLAIRLLVPEGSKLLGREEMQACLKGFSPEELAYEWKHPDPYMDQLHEEVTALVSHGIAQQRSRTEIFQKVWKVAHQKEATETEAALPELTPTSGRRPRAAIPYLNEPWYC